MYEEQAGFLDSEGVRMYTVDMPLPTALRRQTMGVEIDWSRQTFGYAERSEGIEGLIDWVRATPMPTDIHILLPRVSSGGGMRLQRTLLSLGCRVTLRLPLGSGSSTGTPPPHA